MATSPEEAAQKRQASLEKILYRLREMFGEDRAQFFAGDRFRMPSEDWRVVAFPQKLEELSEIMRFCHEQRWRVIPAGTGLWLEMGNQPVESGLIISTERMNRVLEYEPADLTATLEAGATLAAFNQLASKHRQFIPLDPFGEPTMTIGGVVATSSSGPMRYAYGGPRDWVVGMTVVHADGGVTRSGGKVVKNVAGYDLCKIYAGSYGTLAVIADLNFKLRALPPIDRTILLFSKNIQELCRFVARVADSDLAPAAIEMLSPGDILPVGADTFTLAMQFLNEAETVASQLNEVQKFGVGLKHTLLTESEAFQFWGKYRESEISQQWEFSLRITGLPADLHAMIAEAGRILPKTSWRAHAGNGVLRVHAEAGWLDEVKTKLQPRKIAELRRAAESRGGQLLILRAPADITDQLDVWGEVGGAAELMRALKEKFDPDAMLSPGRFVAGI
jgi:glycolate oxidase FAD binding subunit